MERDQVLALLSQIDCDGDIVAQNMVRALTVQGMQVRFVLSAPDLPADKRDDLRQKIHDHLRQSGLTASIAVDAVPELRGATMAEKRAARPVSTPERLPNVKQIVAVGSGKGGVGKSTVSANLAVMAARRGLRVGLLDADIYGPSQQRMFGLSGRPQFDADKKLIPLVNHGVKVMSLGGVVDVGQAIVWRGPKLMGALKQLLFDVAWGELDLLLIDLPPGTGDVQLTLSQKVLVDGGVIVSTPQDIALLDALKGIDMFRKTRVPVLGMVENMAAYICPSCGHEAAIFGHGGVSREATELGLSVLGSLPLDLATREAGDSGAPFAVQADETPQHHAFAALSQAVLQALSVQD